MKTLTKAIKIEQAQIQDSDLPSLRDAETYFGHIRSLTEYMQGGEVKTLSGNPKAKVALTDSNAKLVKEAKRGTGFAYMSTTLLSGSVNGTCVNDKFCADTCVVQHNANRRMFGTVGAGVASRTELFFTWPEAFARLMLRDLIAFSRMKKVQGFKLRSRNNTGADLAWERILPPVYWDTARELGVMHYDYTKRLDRVGYVNDVYRTAYSATAFTRPATIARLLSRGATVALVLPIPAGENAAVPTSWAGLPMVDGNAYDSRWDDPDGHLVGLTAKGVLLQNWRNTGVWGPLVTSLPR